MTDSIQLQFYANHLGNIFGEITDDHIRAIVERAKELGLLPTTEQSSEVQQIAPMSFANYPIKDKPAAPADDEATVDWLNALVFSEGGWCIESRDQAREIVAAIRRGEVPGLPSPHAHEWLQAEVKRLMVEHDARDKEIAELKRLLLEMKGSAIVAERDDAIKQAAEAHDECDALKAEVERLRAELDTSTRVLNASMTIMQSERDAAIARAEKAERNEAVCHCGQRVSDHDARDDGHTPVEMREQCPYHHDMEQARAAHAEAIELLRKCTVPVGLKTYCTIYREIEDHLAKHQNKDAVK